MANVASMVTQVALRSLTGQLQKQAWSTTIYRPQDVANYEGKYFGPDLAEGVQHAVIEREWPTVEDGDR